MFVWLMAVPVAPAQSGGSQLPAAAPAAVGMSAVQLAHIREAVETEIARKQLPGAVVLVGRQGKVVWRRAYGHRALEPQTESMTVDTIFDLASLTKVVATATSVMILVERGQVRLGDPVARYIPEFAEMGKRNITVEQLMTHRSGFMPDNDIKDYEQGPEKAFENIWRLTPIAEAGSRFIYSDVNYIVLAELVRRVSGKPLDLLGGVAGHAGVFSTADDLAVYCQMILSRGEYRGVRVLSPMGVARMTEARASGGNASDGNARGLGWDVVTGYSSNRGDLFPLGSFGHTGFTGTSIWIDPASETFVVFLSNRVHPRVDPQQPADVNSLRGRIASIVAASIIAPPYRDAGTRRRGETEIIAPPPGQPITPGTAASLNGIDAL